MTILEKHLFEVIYLLLLYLVILSQVKYIIINITFIDDDKFKPKDDILKIAGSCLGNKPSEKTKLLISNTLRNRLIKLLPIKVMNLETNTIRRFANNEKAAKYLGTSVNTLVRYKCKGKLLFKIYLITNDMYTHKSYK